MSDYTSVTVIYKRNCSICGRIFNTRQEDKKWCNNGHCRYIFLGIPKKNVLIQVIDETHDPRTGQTPTNPVVKDSTREGQALPVAGMPQE
jgi:hypothetical protein